MWASMVYITIGANLSSIRFPLWQKAKIKGMTKLKKSNFDKTKKNQIVAKLKLEFWLNSISDNIL